MAISTKTPGLSSMANGVAKENHSSISLERHKLGPERMKSTKELESMVLEVLKANGLSGNRAIRESALGMSSHPLDCRGRRAERRLAERFIDRVLPGIAGYISQIRREKSLSRERTEAYFRILDEFGSLFTRSLSYAYNPHPQIPERIGTKFELYETIAEKPGNLEFLLETESTSRKSMIVLAKRLMKKSRYVARLFLASMAEAENLSNLSDDMPHITEETTFNEIRNELNSKMAAMAKDKAVYKSLNDRVRILLERYLSSGQEGREDIMGELKGTISEYPDIDFIRRFSKTGLVKVAHLYFRYMKGRLDAEALVSENIGRVHNELSNLTNLALQSIYASVYKTLSFIYGKPSTSSAIVIAGSNARKEFPFFDIDASIVFESQGMTRKGKQHKEFFDSMEVLMESACEVTGHNFDSLMPRSRMRSGTIDDYIGLVSENNDLLHMFSFLAYGAGSRSTAGDFMSRIREMKYGEYRDPMIKYIARHSDSFKHSEDRPNVKYSRGGLNNVWDLVKINKLSKGLTEDNDTLRQLSQLDIEEGARDDLLSSYMFLIALRIRLDLHYGRNSKDLPSGKELESFARSLGYSSEKRTTAAERLVSDFRKHTKRVHEITTASVIKIVPEHLCAEVIHEKAKEKFMSGEQLSTTETLRLYRDPEFDAYTKGNDQFLSGFSD